jgi:hypothetical protein
MDKNIDIEAILHKRMKTIMIGSLARFEENFDYLWDEDSKSGDRFFDLWQKTREEILDYGNNQIRLAKKDLEELEHNKSSKEKLKYHYKFQMRRQYDEHEDL